MSQRVREKILKIYGMHCTSEIFSCSIHWSMLSSKVKNNRLLCALLTATKEAHKLGTLCTSGIAYFILGITVLTHLPGDLEG